MIEAPSLLWHLDALLPMTDFVSVGTNDLMQYLFAADRGNPRVADRYDPLSPPALRALKTHPARRAPRPARRSRSAARWPAGRWRPSPWSALGFERLSMPPAGIGPVKQMVLSCDREARAARAWRRCCKAAAGSVRDEMETLARKLLCRSLIELRIESRYC